MTRSQVRVLSRPPVLSRKRTTKLSMVSKFGLVAQLVEHRLCKAGVSGSIPLESTIKKYRGSTSIFFYGGVCWKKLELILNEIQMIKTNKMTRQGETILSGGIWIRRASALFPPAGGVWGGMRALSSFKVF